MNAGESKFCRFDLLQVFVNDLQCYYLKRNKQTELKRLTYDSPPLWKPFMYKSIHVAIYELMLNNQCFEITDENIQSDIINASRHTVVIYK